MSVVVCIQIWPPTVPPMHVWDAPPASRRDLIPLWWIWAGLEICFSQLNVGEWGCMSAFSHLAPFAFLSCFPESLHKSLALLSGSPCGGRRCQPALHLTYKTWEWSPPATLSDISSGLRGPKWQQETTQLPTWTVDCEQINGCSCKSPFWNYLSFGCKTQR